MNDAGTQSGDVIGDPDDKPVTWKLQVPRLLSAAECDEFRVREDGGLLAALDAIGVLMRGEKTRARCACGWAFVPGGIDPAPQVTLTLFGRDFGYAFETTRVVRADVAHALPGAPMGCGFRVKFNVNHLRDGEYVVGMAVRTAGVVSWRRDAGSFVVRGGQALDSWLGEIQPIVSVHVPKTAGTTFRQMLQQAFPALTLDYGEPLILAPHIGCIHGHFFVEKYAGILPRARFIAWLRDPIERVVSQYHYWLRTPPPEKDAPPGLAAFYRETPSLLAFAEWHDEANLQRRYLGGLATERYAFLGIADQFARGVALLNRKLGLKLAATTPVNVSPGKTANERHEIEPHVRERIAAMNAADVELYDDVRERFERDCVAHGL